MLLLYYIDSFLADIILQAIWTNSDNSVENNSVVETDNI